MKTISLLQPWASLVALGAKGIETRSRDFTGGYRGPLAIHASKGFPRWAQDLCRCEPFYTTLLSAGFDYGHLKHPTRHLPTGCIVAVCDLVDVVKIKEPFGLEVVETLFWHLRDRPGCSEQELAFGDYSAGRYMYLLKNVYALPEPIPARGQLGLWDYEMEDPRGKTHG